MFAKLFQSWPSEAHQTSSWCVKREGAYDREFGLWPSASASQLSAPFSYIVQHSTTHFHLCGGRFFSLFESWNREDLVLGCGSRSTNSRLIPIRFVAISNLNRSLTRTRIRLEQIKSGFQTGLAEMQGCAPKLTFSIGNGDSVSERNFHRARITRLPENIVSGHSYSDEIAILLSKIPLKNSAIDLPKK